LYDALGGDQLDRILGDPSTSPDLMIVLDALDEAQLRVTEGGFDAFLTDVGRKLAPPTGTCRCIMLARLETSIYIQLKLEGLAIRFRHLRIDFFDRDSAVEFVAQRLRQRANEREAPALPDIRHRWFEETINQLFEDLARDVGGPSSIWEDEQTRRFLGYAPTLQAIADTIFADDDGAPARTFQEAISAREAPDVWSLMASIAQKVLDREQQKIIERIQDRLDVASSTMDVNWMALYQPFEQLRLAAMWIGGGTPQPITQGMPPEVANKYTEVVREQLPQHAFVGEPGKDGRRFANLVFEQYTYAQLLLKGDLRDKDLARRRLVRLSNPLLGRFVLVSDAAGSGGMAHDDIPLVYESLLLSAETDESLRLEITEGEQGSINLQVYVGKGDGRCVIVSAQNKDLVLRHRAARTDILLDRGVSLGTTERPLILGPNLNIDASMVMFEATDVRVAPGAPVSIHVGDTLIPATGFTRIVARREDLEINAPDLPWPYSDYAPEDDLELDLEVMLFACRILQRFSGSSSVEGLRRGKLLIENVAVGRKDLGRGVLAFLIDDGLVIDTARGSYELSTERISQRGISFVDVSRRVFSQALRELASDFRNWQAARVD
jgi:hypothetical protein